ncbi:Class II abasic (AP) endonuclease [Coniothyrium glycines]
MVRITTWNVNGIRNPFGYKPWSTTRTFNAMFDILEADIVVMQELKIQRKDLTDDMVLVPGWDCYFSLPKHKKGYSGVAIYTRQEVCAPIRAEEGILGILSPPNTSTPYRELPESAAIGGYPTSSQIASLGDVDPHSLDAEGRCLILEFPAFVLFGVYSPANSNGLRDNFRLGFLTMLDTRIRNLARMGKNVILTGDLNVSRDLIDTAKAEDSMRSEGMTHEEYLNTPNRRIFNQLLHNGKVPGLRDEGREQPILYDLCREFHPDREGMYTHWEQKINARPGNFGSRIDFILCSITIKHWFEEADIQEGLMGSDHCPVYAVAKEAVPQMENGVDVAVHLLDCMNPPGMFENGLRLKNYDEVHDVPALSGRLLSEFTKRRNIRDMFTKTHTPPIHAPSTSITSRKEVVTSRAPHWDSLLTASSPGKKTTNSLFDIPSLPAKDEVARARSPSRSLGKRRLSVVTSPDKLAKRTKLNTGATMAKAKMMKGQQSLSGFLQSRTTNGQPATTKDQEKHTSSCVDSDHTVVVNGTAMSLLSPSNQLTISSEPFDPDPRASQEASKETWTKLFSKKPTPRCEHGDPCQILTTRKSGINNGRQFYMCSRPIGPSGQKETGTQWRCGTFIWSSDWKGS